MVKAHNVVVSETKKSNLGQGSDVIQTPHCLHGTLKHQYPTTSHYAVSQPRKPWMWPYSPTS